MAFALQSAPISHSIARKSHATRTARPILCSASVRTSDFAKKAQNAGAAGLLAAAFMFAPPALAELNKYEAEVGGEFGSGTALQYGEADLKGQDFAGQDLRRSNFTSADCRNANFKGAKLQAAYFIKTVAFRANFEDANLSDTLMDRAVLNEANLRNAILTRGVFTRSDFGGADIYGADFTNALVDRAQQIALCRYADGVNPVTGEDTRKTLGCGSKRRFRESSPSNPEGPQVSEDEKADFVKTMPIYRQ